MRNFKKFLALVLATMMVLGGMVTVSAAEEAVTYDYTEAAKNLAALDIVKGTSDDVIDFALNEKVVRYQMALLFARIMTGETNDLYWSKVADNTTPFDDVTNYYGAISYVAENGVANGKGWIAGVGDNCFDPNGPITYEQALAMAVRSLGYKQLVYPTGFVNTAKNLGITEGLEELAGDTQLTRGQMFQIIYNTLYVEDENGVSFASKNFGLETKTYVIVATNLQYMIGADRVEKTGYVALAELNADGTYNYDNYVHFTEAELGLAKGEAELKIGYSYTVRSFNKYADVYDIVANTTKTVQNYGDNGIAIAAGTKYNNVTDTSLVKVDGTTYSLVTSFSNLNNKNTSVGKNPELIVHSLFKGASDTAFQYYIYDSALNILDQNGDIALYNFMGTYYVKLDVGYRVATADDFAAYAINIAGTSTDMYGTVTKATDLTQIQFSEITLIDDNNDGKWDRGIYIPYSVGLYATSSQANAWRIANSSDSGTTKLTTSSVNGVYLNAIATSAAGVWASRPKIQTSDVTFNGKGKPASGEYVVYYYNPYSRVFTVVENLGKPATGTVQALTQGTYAYDSTNQTYCYNNATVTIDGTTYKVGYRPYTTRSQAFLTAREDEFAAGVKTDLQYIDSQIANYGYSTELYSSLLASNYKKMSYVVLAGRIIKASSASNSCGWMVFDYGTYTTTTSPYTSYSYTGDIIGVDTEGNILVKAFVDKTGEPVVAKIGSINGFSYGLLVDDYAALQYQFTGIGVLGTNAMDTMKKVVISNFFKTLTADLADNRQYVYIVTGVSDDGVYEIYTDLELYWGTDGLVYRQPSKLASQNAVTIRSGISTTTMRTDAGTGKVLVLNADSVILVVGKDGIFTATGIPADNTTINFNLATTYTVSNDFIFIASKDYTAAQLYTGTFDASRNLNAYNYYMVVGNVANNSYQGNTVASSQWNGTTMVYTYTNMYCLNTGEYATLTVEGGLPSYVSTDIFGANAVKPIGAIYAEKNGEYKLLTTLENYNSSLALGNYKYATDVATWLDVLLQGNANSAYASVFEKKGTIAAASKTGYTLDLTGTANDIYENFALKYDRINVAFNDDGILTSVTINNNVSTTSYASGTIYYTHKAGTSFQGTILNVTGTTSDAAKLAAAKTAAIAKIEAAAKDYDADLVLVSGAVAGKTVTEAIAYYTGLINAAKTIDAIPDNAKTFADQLLEAKNAAADNATLAAAKAAAIAKIDAVLAKYDANMVVNTTTGKTAAERANDFKKQINAATSVTNTYIANIDSHAQRLDDELKAAKDALDASATGVVSMTSNAIVLRNVSGITGVTVYTKDASGYYTQAVISVTSDGAANVTGATGYTAANITINRAGTDVTISFNATDASGALMTAFAAGEYCVVITCKETVPAQIVTVG